MRNYVSKVLIGTAVANVTLADVDLLALTEGQVVAFDWDTRLGLVAGSKNIGFARGTATLGAPILSGIIPKANLTATLNPYEAAVLQKNTLTVNTVPAIGKSVLVKVIYHDNLSIVPNQTKQTVVSVVADAVNTATTTTWAAAIAAEFNKQEYKFVTVTAAVNVVTFEGITLTTQSNYNHIDRPEFIVFEVGAPTDDADLGTYSVAITVPGKSGQGDPAKMAWMEEQSMGRRGFSDRRMWNDTKKYETQVEPGETYAVLVVQSDKWVEGDQQGLRANPVGCVIGGAGGTVDLLLVDLAVAGIVPTTVAAS